MKDLNQCNFIGRLGRDPEIRYLQSGTPVANLSIAVGNVYKNNNQEKIEETEWVRLTAFGKLAEIIGEYCVKGQRIFVSGRMKTDKWTDQNGVDRYTTKVLIDQMQMLDGGNRQQSGQQQGQQQQSQGRPQQQRSQQQAPPPEQGFDFDDDIPF